MPSSSYASSPEDIPKYNTQFEPGPNDDETLWNVLEIVKESRDKYLVKWEGVDPDTGKPWDLSWVPKHDCTNDLIHEWKVSKAKQAQAQKKRRKSKDDIYANDPKSVRKANNGAKSRISAVSAAPAVAGPSELNASSGIGFPVIEIARTRKRRRDAHSIDGDSEVYSVVESVSMPKKKRKIDTAPSTRSSNGQSHSPGRRPPEITLPHRKSHIRSPQKKGPGKHDSIPRSSSSSRHQPRRALNPDTSQTRPTRKRALHISPPGSGTDDEELVARKSLRNGLRLDPLYSVEHEDFEGLYTGADMSLDGIIPPGHDTGELRQRSRSPSLASPHDLIVGTSKSAGTIIPETQSSTSVSQLKHQATTSAKHFLHKTDGEAKTNGDLAKDSEHCNITTKSKRGLGPVPTISPGTFEAYVSKAHATPLKSSIDTFESPSKGQSTTHKAKSHWREPVTSQRRQKPEYHQLSHERSKSQNNGDSALHDPIEDFDSHSMDEALKLRGAKVAEAVHLRRSSLAPSKPSKRPLSDVITRLNGPQSHLNADDVESNGVAQEVESDQLDHGHVEMQSQDLGAGANRGDISQSPNWLERHRNISKSKGVDRLSSRSRTALSLQDGDSIDRDQRNSDEGEMDELGPEDAPDTRDSAKPSRTTDVPSSAEINYSLVANTGLTPRSTFQPPVIASPVRELNHALGLLNRKSEEIEILKVSLKKCQSRVAELDEEVLGLKRDKESMEERYEEMNAALKQERAAAANEEERAEEDSTTKDLTSSSSPYADRFMELLQENELLKRAKARLESDTDMLRKLYAQASDAHQTRVVEIRTLKRDNDSLREQATTGVKQAQMHWSTQVNKLENELARVQGVVEVLTDQARHTDDDIRRRAALFPITRREAEAAKQEVDDWKTRFMELGRENTRLRLEVKEWEDEAMIRRKTDQELKEQGLREQELKEQEAVWQNELVWMCPWMDIEHGARCGALLESREELREHFYQAGHI